MNISSIILSDLYEDFFSALGVSRAFFVALYLRVIKFVIFERFLPAKGFYETSDR